MSSDRAHNLHHRLSQGETVLMPGVWDPLSALLTRDAGFTTVFMSGFCVSATLLGEPDIGLVTQAEMAEVARRVCAAVPDINVVVDADTGYGNPSNVIRTVDLWEQAGAAGMFLEDQVWPKSADTWTANRSCLVRIGWQNYARQLIIEMRCTSLHALMRAE